MGMPKIELRLQMFRGDWDQVWSQQRLLWPMEALVRVNQTHIRQFDEFKKRGMVENSYPPIYRAGLHYETEKGTEIWPDLPSLISGAMGDGLYPGAWGDCLPVSTLVMRDDFEACPIGMLKPGDRIMGDGGWTTVVDQAITGKKPILAIELNNGCFLRCSPNHRVFLANGEEILAEKVKPGMLLRTPTKPFPEGRPFMNPHLEGKMSPEDLAWLVGVHVADGWSEFPVRGRFSISGKDGHKKEEQKRRVAALMEKAGIETRWTERYIAVNDSNLAEYMDAAGHGAPQKHVPRLEMTTAQARAMLQGLGADASTANSGTKTHGTTSSALALQTRVLFRMLGQSVHIRKWDDHGGLGTNPIYRITVRRGDDEVGKKQWNRRNSARVVSVSEDAAELCADITTDTGRFWLPESDLIVHNCEDFACARAAEYRELPFHYARPVTDAMFKAWVASGAYPKDAPPNKKRVERSDPRFPQTDADFEASKAGKDWPGWKKMKGGVKAKPFAKWRRGPQGNYHYHALTLLPDGRLEDPSLVLGMGKEKEFSEAGMAEKMKDPNFIVKLQFAKAPLVMVVDPEKPSGFAGGQAVKLDAKIQDMIAKGMTPEDVSMSLGDAEVGAYLTNTIALSDGEFDVDSVIGWNRSEARFEPKTAEQELRRLAGYAKH